ncbi:aldehyde dehydrogenase family protein [Rhizobium sp. SEMIA 4085]|nr:aldehyde dehydrogenase family protein [Rhizobium sp. SEMIA 4085]
MISPSSLTRRLKTPSLLSVDSKEQEPGCATFEVRNPSTGELLARLPDMGAGEAAAAIDRAEVAFVAWKSLTARARSNLIRRWYELIHENAEDLAAILTAEMGKPLDEARSEVSHAAAYIQWYAEEANRIYGETIPASSEDRRLFVLRQPVGVVGAITPWNFPASMVARKIAPALAAGCTVVLKPAEQTPLVAAAMVTLAREAGVPQGVVEIVYASEGDAIGREFCSNPKVRKISFTGSTEVGRILMRQCADQIKKVSFELGGNAPFIVFDDADIDAAVEGAIQAKFRNGGQTRGSGKRPYGPSKGSEEFAEKGVARARGKGGGGGCGA